MNRKTLSGWLLALVVMSVSVFAALEDQQKNLVQSNAAFACDLYQQLRTQEKGNLFFSPYSISDALAMTYAGARGETASQMAKALRFQLYPEAIHPVFAELNRSLDAIQKDGQVQLSVANSIWPSVQAKLLPGYVNLLKENYGVAVTPLDYGKPEDARQTINRWVETKTQDKIKELIAPGVLSPNTMLTLVNAIYFKGSWLQAFDPKATTDQDFYTGPDGVAKKVPMMALYRKSFRYADMEDAQVLELPYQGKALAMWIVLPKDRKGLDDIESSLSRRTLKQWNDSLRQEEVNVALPKFKITWGTFQLNKSLIDLGMKNAFGDADFSGMDGKRDLSIGAVLHKAFIDVNEEGTEAAAATGVVMVKSAMPVKAVASFRADHPFLFLIRDVNSGSILFLGRVLDPAP